MKTALFGIGSAHGDDQIGWLLVDQLQAADTIPAIQMEKLALPLAPLIHQLSQFEHIVVIDAAELGMQPGDYLFYHQADALLQAGSTISSHALGLAECWQIAKALKLKLPQISLFLVQLGHTAPMAAISTRLEQRIPDMLAELTSYLSSHETVTDPCIN